jgi:FixJ family two-component response regulator
VVIVIDDDPSIRRSIERLVRAAGFKVQTSESAALFLRSQQPDGPACLVVDVHMPGLSGIDLQRELGRTNRRWPIIFITGRGDIPMSVQAMKAGAIEFLTKPFRDQDLLDAIRQGIERDIVAREHQARLAALRADYALLTAREREVMTHVVSGKLNKQIAAALGTTEKTIKVHRSHVMQKMRADSVADLVRMAGYLEPQRYGV